MALTVTVDASSALSELAEAGERMSSPGCVRSAAMGVARLVRGHFRARENDHQKFSGGSPTHFWAQAARSVSLQGGDRAVMVTISKQGVRLRWAGGDVVARDKLLTLPATGEAYGKRAGEFHDLEYAVIKGVPCLRQAAQTLVAWGRKRKDGSRGVKSGGGIGGKVFFWLVETTHHAEDPSVLPDEQEMLDAAVAGAGNYLRARQAKSATGGGA
jgi:hypothetical protein